MKEDLRVVKSQRAIEAAFLDLVQRKGFENVRMIDIADAAMVNRNTIYLHYGSKEGIINEIVEREFKKKLNDFINKDKYQRSRSKSQISKIFAGIFTAIEENIEAYRILLTDSNLSGYLSQSIKKITDFIMEDLEDTFKNKTIVSFVISGIYEVIRRWIVYDTGTVEENQKYLTELVYSNMRHCTFK